MWLGCFDADLVLVWSCLVGFRLLWVLIWDFVVGVVVLRRFCVLCCI